MKKTVIFTLIGIVYCILATVLVALVPARYDSREAVYSNSFSFGQRLCGSYFAPRDILASYVLHPNDHESTAVFHIKFPDTASIMIALLVYVLRLSVYVVPFAVAYIGKRSGAEPVFILGMCFIGVIFVKLIGIWDFIFRLGICEQRFFL